MWRTQAFDDGIKDARRRQQVWRTSEDLLTHRRETAYGIGNSGYQAQYRAAESAARNALDAAVSAYNFLEDHPLADIAHQHAHAVGEFVGGIFGCWIRMYDGVYWDECPATLMHHRWGFSPGYTSRRLCSICFEDIDDCPHLIGQKYEMIAARDDQGRCNCCGWTDCSHVPGQSVEVNPVAIHGDIDLEEVSMVSRPRDPLARPTRISLDVEALGAVLDLDSSEGILRCYRCVNSCEGFIDPSFDF
ncbi:hypothetical protein IOD16_27155 [Saccharothrix sp. 6-C]|uniref:hypothetical protein n=1 Tax=Saccharothrix sp. 6-C TaxID=2781735 RepID=UPI001916F09E|nr:hypothetical protein [Saccharothrix sp. 6-C]QQQ74794.1 hypothetical protein IOD16_27155 [Saccharothrix sp. 6-C]